ncbi:phage antirepressor KilAC domain-containing protein [Rhodovulum sulfidophilum]
MGALWPVRADRGAAGRAHDRLTKADGSLNVTEAAKALGVRPKDLFAWLSEKRPKETHPKTQALLLWPTAGSRAACVNRASHCLGHLSPCRRSKRRAERQCASGR